MKYLVFLCSLVLISCGDDEPEPAIPNITGNWALLEEGTNFERTITIESASICFQLCRENYTYTQLTDTTLQVDFTTPEIQFYDLMDANTLYYSNELTHDPGQRPDNKIYTRK